MVPTPKHDSFLELQLSCALWSASFDLRWGQGPAEREQWQARWAAMADSWAVLTADECLQESGMSRAGVYNL